MNDNNINKTFNLKPVDFRQFFVYWVNFIKPYHNLSEKCMNVFAELLYQRYLFSQSISDSNLLEEIVMNVSTKNKIAKHFNITNNNLNLIYRRISAQGVIKNNRINPLFIPPIEKDKKSFKLLFIFNVDESKK
ncbi:MAG: hypothetical protein LBM05_00600 [Endomicrobium sp.]|jgi:hypothetical protein|nr:hypothetical protein [Endomicrobium sp.]